MYTIRVSKTKVCIIIPAYNEASVIASVINDIASTFNNSSYDTDIVVVNDGSKDDTSSVSNEEGARVIDHILNTGAGGATSTGLRYAQKYEYDIAATMDADGQHIAKDVRRGIDLIVAHKSDLVIGSRLINADGMSHMKRLGNWGLTTITYLLFGIKVTDSQSGLRIFSKNALRELRWKTTGYEFCSEMLWRANQQHLKIEEYQIQAIYTDYSKGKGQNNWNAVNIIKSLVSRRISELFG